MTTPRLGAPELSTSQSNKEQTVNEALYWLDAASLGGFKIIDRDLATPPGSPAQGDCYLVAASPTGAWAGHAGAIALYINTSWAFRTPQNGFEAWVVDEDVKIAYSGGAWGITGTFDGATYVPSSYLDTDGTLAANSDSKVATQKAVKTYVDGKVIGLLDLKTNTDCSANPNYPPASKGDTYIVSVAGKIGGASGQTVDIGDVFVASADNAGGTQASVGSSWFILEHNLVGAIVGSGALLAANNLSDLASPATARANLGLNAVSTQSGTSYTALLADAASYIQFSNASPITFTVPPNSSVAFPIGTVIEVEQSGAGALTIAPGSGVTINSRGADLTLAGQYAVAALKKVATDTWTLTGDL